MSNGSMIDVSLNNSQLYAGCEIQEVAGRLVLTTPVKDAVNIVGRNANKLVDELVASGIEDVTLSGGMAIWAYLVVFHVAVHRFRKLYYQDGKAGEPIVI